MWRLATNYLKEKSIPKIREKRDFYVDNHPIVFDKTHHKSFCAELKMLYTVATRAKRQILIYEDSPLEELPMIFYWYKRDLIKIFDLHDLEERGESSLFRIGSFEFEKWKKQGDVYMEKKLWHAARKCYRKADEKSLENVAHALALEKKAKSTKHTDALQFMSAAVLFIKSCESTPKKEIVKNAAICLYHAKMYTEAIQLFELIHEVRDSFIF